MLFRSLLFSALLSTPGFANTVTWDDAPTQADISFTSLRTYTEDGITVTAEGGYFANYYGTGMVHLDGYDEYAHTLIFTMDTLFDAVSIDIHEAGFNNELSYNILGTDEYDIAFNVPFDNLVISGTGGTNPSITLNMLEWSNDLLAPFTDLNSLTISFAPYPTATDFDNVAGGVNSSVFCNDQCSHLNVGNVVLNPVTVSQVPIPASILLLIGGIAGLGLVRGRRILS